MATYAPYPLQSDVVAADRSVLMAVEALGDYAPPNPAYSVAAAREAEAQLVAAQQNEECLMREILTAHDRRVAAAWALHELIKGMKLYVAAQYGPDSPALHAIGYKRRSERKRPARRQPRGE